MTEPTGKDFEKAREIADDFYSMGSESTPVNPQNWLANRIAQALANERAVERKEMQRWIDDLQSGMFINCVYCGHRYGPKEKTPTSMADVLKEHVEKCPKHPMSKLREDAERLMEVLDGAVPFPPSKKAYILKSEGGEEEVALLISKEAVESATSLFREKYGEPLARPMDGSKLPPNGELKP